VARAFKPVEPADLKELWGCEGCGCVFQGVSPPDRCEVCEHEFFESVFDAAREAELSSRH
jgi:rubrerythrin